LAQTILTIRSVVSEISMMRKYRLLSKLEP
jgi:hypothetical protein